MSNLLRFALVLLPLAACATSSMDDSDTDVDDAITDSGKADDVQALKHYVMFAREGKTYVVRANGGTMRCENDKLAEQCEIDESGVVAPGGLGGSSDVMIDELNDQPLLVSGRIVRASSGAVFLRASSATFALTSVVPSVGPDHPDTSVAANCFQMRKQANADIKYTRLDGSKVTTANVTEVDAIDPTPDTFGPSPATEKKIDDAIDASATKTVYACGFLEFRTDVHQWWFDAEQMFVNL